MSDCCRCHSVCVRTATFQLLRNFLSGSLPQTALAFPDQIPRTSWGFSCLPRTRRLPKKQKRQELSCYVIGIGLQASRKLSSQIGNVPKLPGPKNRAVNPSVVNRGKKLSYAHCFPHLPSHSSFHQASLTPSQSFPCIPVQRVL